QQAIASGARRGVGCQRRAKLLLMQSDKFLSFLPQPRDFPSQPQQFTHLLAGIRTRSLGLGERIRETPVFRGQVFDLAGELKVLLPERRSHMRTIEKNQVKRAQPQRSQEPENRFHWCAKNQTLSKVSQVL